MPKYLVKYSMAGHWQQEIEADSVEHASWAFDIAKCWVEAKVNGKAQEK